MKYRYYTITTVFEIHFPHSEMKKMQYNYIITHILIITKIHDLYINNNANI